MYTLHSVLKRVKTARLGGGDVAGEALGEVLHYDAVGAGEEGENHFYKVLFVGGGFFPVGYVLGEVDFCRGGSEASRLESERRGRGREHLQ